jgi:hypothetical protein
MIIFRKIDDDKSIGSGDFISEYSFTTDQIRGSSFRGVTEDPKKLKDLMTKISS